jgi:lipoprotein NlpD
VCSSDLLYSIAREHGLSARDIAAWNNLDNNNRIGVGQTLRLTPPGAPPATPAQIGADGTEIRPIATEGSVVARPLDAAPPPTAVPPTQNLGGAQNTATLKFGPKGGKVPFSEENLARLKGGKEVPPTPAPPTPSPSVAAPVPTPAPAAPPADTSGIDWAWPSNGKVLSNFSEGGASAQEMVKGIDIGGRIGDPVLAAAAGKVIFVGAFPKHGNLVVVLHSGGYSSVYAHNSRILVKEQQMVTRGQKLAELGNSDSDQPKLHFEVRQQGKPVDPLKFLPAR